MFTEAQVFAEVSKIQYLYQLKHVIRYGETRTDMSESVAEHVFGMHILANYFLPLEDSKKTWNKSLIYEMITWHDIDEIETGDTIGYLKSTADRKREHDSMQIVIAKSPDIIQRLVADVSDEYQKQETIESRFVKALDRIEPLFQIYNENGKAIQLRNKTTIENHRKIKDAYVAAFPSMAFFNAVISAKMDQEGFFVLAP